MGRGGALEKRQAFLDADRAGEPAHLEASHHRLDLLVQVLEGHPAQKPAALICRIGGEPPREAGEGLALGQEIGHLAGGGFVFHQDHPEIKIGRRLGLCIRDRPAENGRTAEGQRGREENSPSEAVCRPNGFRAGVVHLACNLKRG